MIAQALKLSILIAFGSTFVVGISGTFLGYFFARYRFFGKDILDTFMTLPLVLPPTVIGYYLLIILGKNGIIGSWIGWTPLFTWQAALAASVVVSFPLMFKTARNAFENVSPQYEKVAFSFGKNRWETFTHITLPLASRGLMTGLVLSFARALGEFGATYMIAGNIPGKTQTMPLAIYEAVATGQDAQAKILSLILISFSLTVVLFANKSFNNGKQNVEIGS